MKYKELKFAALSLPKEDIYLAMDYHGNTPDNDIRGLIDEVLHEVATLCIPRYQYDIVDASLLANNCLQVQDTQFSIGRIIGSYLPGMTQVCLFVATAGREYETYLHQLRTEGDIVKEFVADSIGSVIAEVCVTEIGRELDRIRIENQKQDNDNRAWKYSMPYSPGYCGWNINEQTKLFAFFPDRPCDISLSDSCLMSPVKSISGFIALGKDLKPQPYRCEICNNKHCYKRKEKNNEKYERVGT